MDRFEARLQGYKGGEGIIEFAQAVGKNTQVMVVISGLKENSVCLCMFKNVRVQLDYCRSTVGLRWEYYMSWAVGIR